MSSVSILIQPIGIAVVEVKAFGGGGGGDENVNVKLFHT